MTAIANLPDLRPSLLLDFANSGRVDPRIQCTRASSATCFGPDGKLRTVAANVPRIDYDPATGKCLGLLVEEGRTNMLINSVFSGASAGTPGTAPTSFGFGVAGGTTEVVSLGTNSAVRLKSATAARHFLTQTNIPVAVGSYCFSVNCYFYIASRVIDAITVLAGSAVVTLRYFVDGVEVTANTQIEVGRRKLTVQFDVTTAGNVAPRFGVGVATASVGDVEMGLPQLEAGAFPTSYIPTEASAVTRAADQVSLGYALPTVGAIVSSLAQVPSTNPNNAYMWSAINPANHNTDHAYVYRNGSVFSTNFWVKKDSVDTAGGNIVGHHLNVGLVYDTGAKTIAIASDSLLGLDTSARPKEFPDNLTSLLLGQSRVGSNFLNGCLSRLAVYSGRVTNAQLQRLTA